MEMTLPSYGDRSIAPVSASRARTSNQTVVPEVAVEGIDIQLDLAHQIDDSRV